MSMAPRRKTRSFLGLEKYAGRWTDYLVVINRDDEAEAKKHRLVPLQRLVYMPGIGVDTRGNTTRLMSLRKRC